MSDYQSLMRNLLKSHQIFWKEMNSCSRSKPEPQTVTFARNKMLSDLDKLWYIKLSPLQIKFIENPLDTVDEVIEFLSVDILAFRCGYVKEFFLTKLKSIAISNLQRAQLKEVTLNLCKKPRFRREFGDWARLMIKIADQSFINQLDDLSKNSDTRIKTTSEWLRNKIVENRKDLQSVVD